jgi:hypothetical protein
MELGAGEWINRGSHIVSTPRRVSGLHGAWDTVWHHNCARRNCRIAARLALHAHIRSSTSWGR